MKASPIIHQKTGHAILLANNREFPDSARLHFRDAGDDPCPGAALLLHTPLVA
jgi:hypothetical protein